MKNHEWKMKIDTMTLRIYCDNLTNYQGYTPTAIAEDLKFRAYVSEYKVVAKEISHRNCIKITLQLSKYQGEYDHSDTMYNYNTQLHILRDILLDIGVDDTPNLNNINNANDYNVCIDNIYYAVDIDRVDFCFDSIVKLSEILTESYVFLSLYALKYGVGTPDKWDNIDQLTTEVRVRNVRQKGRWLTIYNKSAISPTSRYNTRLELRYTRYGNSRPLQIEEKLTEIENILTDLPTYYDDFISMQSDFLINHYDNYIASYTSRGQSVGYFSNYIDKVTQKIPSGTVLRNLYVHYYKRNNNINRISNEKKEKLRKAWNTWSRSYWTTHEHNYVYRDDLKLMLDNFSNSIFSYKNEKI